MLTWGMKYANMWLVTTNKEVSRNHVNRDGPVPVVLDKTCTHRGSAWWSTDIVDLAFHTN